MKKKSELGFPTVRTQGAILPADLLQRVAELDKDLPGLKPTDFGLAKSEKIGEAISRSWNRMRGIWADFREEAAELAGKEALRGTTETRENWLLPLFQELGYGKLATGGYEIDGKNYPISHRWNLTPIHLVSFKFDLDRRTPGVAGAARSSPHSLVQEFLNRSDDHLWAFLSNGFKLRILRDNVSLTRLAFVEFDLESMMEGEAYADFSLLWLLCHRSRVEADIPESCLLERWSQEAHKQGTRALDRLREGVEEAIRALGSGFLAFEGNQTLRQQLRSGELDKQDYFREVLRLVYRLIFLFAAEDREQLFAQDAPLEKQERYARYFSTSRLRGMAGRTRGSRHPDLYRMFRLLARGLGSNEGLPELGLAGLGSFLWSDRSTPHLDRADLSNSSFLEAIRALAFAVEDGVFRSIDYRNLGPEELGSVYESLLELQPDLHLESATFKLTVVAGSERKTTGSYYTNERLIQALLDTSLDPLLDEAERAENPEEALLSLKVCDPACGSGHFLIAAAHRIAERLASVRTGDEQPGPDVVQHALREVIAKCVYGVDINEMALELCKINLWLEALEPGKPLSFLDHHFQCGNSLLGATPACIREGIPDDAFKPITADDRSVCNEFKAQNRNFRKKRQRDLFAGGEAWEKLGNLPEMLAQIEALPDETVTDVRVKESRYAKAIESADYVNARLLADAWASAFVWKKVNDPERPFPITEEIFRKIEANPHTCPGWMRDEIGRLAGQYRFFHWHLAYPDVFHLSGGKEKPENDLTGWDGGFSLMVGNPPWERVKLQEKEWFAPVHEGIANARNKAERGRMIDALKNDDPALYAAFQDARRVAEGESHLLRSSGRYPLAGRGDVNTYQVFAELFRSLIASSGRVGIIVPTGLATDDTMKYFFQDLMESGSLSSLYDFENRKKLFPAVDSRMKFCLLTLTGPARPATSGADFVFFAQETGDIRDEERHFTLTAEEIELLNPNTKTCPIFRSKKDAELTKAIYRRVPVLIKEGPPEENPWGIKFSTMFHMSNDSHLFRTREQMEAEGFELEGNHFVRGEERWLPLYEAKMIHQFDHRFADVVLSKTAVVRQGQTYELTHDEHRDPLRLAMPRYWVKQEDVARAVSTGVTRAMLGFADVTSVTNERTMLATLLPFVGVGHTMPLIFTVDDDLLPSLCSCLNSFVLDYVGRQKVGGLHYTYNLLKQIPAPAPSALQESATWDLGLTVEQWLRPRIVELSASALDLTSDLTLAGERVCFLWDRSRRAMMRAELDAAFFHLYLGPTGGWQKESLSLREHFRTPREAVLCIMETFPIVRRKDAKEFGSYRTKEMIVHVYDKMQEAIETGEPYQTILEPPPGDARMTHSIPEE